ncbi:FkbM family methyltransferase [Acaryochloris marina NIES-2412]|uniref:FkbM family methyltransferase n=1 Tax=Acaryochloris marina TaxID=155978 RepID=UPI004059AC1E
MSEAEEDFHSAVEDIDNIISIMKPKPSPYPLIRIGGGGDGGYLLPNDLTSVKACFSPGVNNKKTFEDELVALYGIHCHMCDKSSDSSKFKTPLKPEMQTFKQKWLDINGASDSISLEEWIDQLCPNNVDDLVLQMDIEGAEYRNLLEISDQVLRRFRIIVIEFHRLRGVMNSRILDRVISPVFKKIDKDFLSVHAHPNNCCGDFLIQETGINLPNIIELTFLRRDRFKVERDKKMFPIFIPHPLDVVNVRRRAPSFLNKSWLPGKRPLKSRLKILTQVASYAIREIKQSW